MEQIIKCIMLLHQTNSTLQTFQTKQISFSGNIVCDPTDVYFLVGVEMLLAMPSKSVAIISCYKFPQQTRNFTPLLWFSEIIFTFHGFL